MSRLSSFFLKRAFAVSFSFSLAFSCYSYSHIPSLPKVPSNLSIKRRCSSYSSPSPSQKLAADLLSLLGSAHDAARIPKDEASQLKSCLLFLVPPTSHASNGILEVSEELRGRELSKEDKKVWWPPAPVMELARLAVDSGGDPGSIQRALDPTVLSVPDCEGLKKDKCQLTRTIYAHRFVDKGLNSYFEFLFQFIVERASSLGVNVLLNRYDLFHGHLFLARNSGRLGILFHAREYPAYEKKEFPYHLGFCQTGSNVIYDDSMNLRNILWLAPLPSDVTKAWLAPGTLVILDAHPGGIIYNKLIPEYARVARTIDEDDFGEVVVDVNYLNVNYSGIGEKIFIC